MTKYNVLSLFIHHHHHVGLLKTMTNRTVTTGKTMNEKLQEGWLSPTERASFSAISLRHNLATSGESRRYVVAFTCFAVGGIWLRQESVRHILLGLQAVS